MGYLGGFGGWAWRLKGKCMGHRGDAWTFSELRFLPEALHSWIADLFEAV